MDKNAIKKFAVWARRELIARVSQKALQYGISEGDCGNPEDDSVDGRVLSKAEKAQRQTLIRRIKAEGYRQVMEEAAYTWFNRFIALRFMEVNGYLPSHVRVFTDDQGAFKPQILTEAINLDLDGLDMEQVYALKDANKTEELYKYLLIVQCNALNPILPGMFQRIEDYTELLFPDNLLREGSVIDRMVRQGESDSIPESDWTDQVQIIGWLYQYYNTEPKDQVFADLKKNIKITKEKIPAATQLFTPDWIVRYMVENSLGRLWVEGHPAAKEKFLPVHNEDGSVRKEDGRWNYYLEEAEQEPEVQAQLAVIRKEYAALTPEEIRVIDPCCGSGHILCYLFDVLEQIYEDYGYTAREAAQKIVQHNLHGLDIDPRAVQLSYFAVMMKARQYDRRFFSRNIQPMVYSPEGYPEGMEYGSLITVDELEPTPDFDNWTIHDGDYMAALNRWSFRYVLSQKYHVVVTNPPYMASSGMGETLGNYLKEYYPLSKGDLFAAFIERCLSLTASQYYTVLITQQSWMFLSSYEKLRNKLSLTDVSNILHLGAHAFEEQGGEVVQTVAFILHKTHIPDYISICDRLVSVDDPLGKENAFLCGLNRFSSRKTNFELIPAKPYAYWISQNALKNFEERNLGTLAEIVSGMTTGNNEVFLRAWTELDVGKIAFNKTTLSAIDLSKTKWIPYHKGGEMRKWYGNHEYVVNWSRSSEFNRAKTTMTHVYLKPCITWSDISGNSFAGRYCHGGFMFDVKGSCAFAEEKDLQLLIGIFNSKVTPVYIEALNPTTTTQVGDLKRIPLLIPEDRKMQAVRSYVLQNIEIAKEDWDSFEFSWDFKEHPFIPVDRFHVDGAFVFANLAHYKEGLEPSCPVEACFLLWQKECNGRFLQLKQNEEELNRIFIDIYGLQDELSPEVEDKDVTVRKADFQREICSFISYAVGCMFGRYSLDMPGLAFAGGSFSERFINAGNPLTDENGDLLVDENGDYLSDGENCYSVIRVDGKEKRTTFAPDYDNILPICDDEYFEDDIVRRFVEFVETVYGKDTLEENLKYIADALGGKGSPREVIRNYFLNDFYADHLKVYQKRPIYWLFDSGKKNGFKCLIYMHRYQPDTIARIRTDYVHELQGRYRTAIADLERRISDAATAERVKLSKQLSKLQAQADELRDYEEKIHHLADQMIPIDFDDGVKVNYAKFQDVLAKIK